MCNIELTYNTEYYQPNILIALFLGLYQDKDGSLSIQVVHEDLLQPLRNQIINIFTVNEKSLIEITQNNNYLILKIKQQDYILFKNNIVGITDEFEENINCKDFIEKCIKNYIYRLTTDTLRDENINIDSWKTISEKFIDSIDTRKNPNDYKIFNIDCTPAILKYYFDNLIYFSKIELKYISENVTNILDDSCWEIKYVLCIKPLIRMLYENEEKNKAKYSIREQKILDLVEHHIEINDLYIAPEDLIDMIDDKGNKPYEKQKKYISNFISRLNKKYMVNTGRKRFCGKIFNGVYKINL